MVQQAQPQQGQPGMGPQPGTKWVLDTGNSGVSFVVRHFGVAFVRGVFNKFQGEIEFDPNNVAASRVSATVDTASFDTNNQRRDDDLRGANYLDVQNHPQMTFKSKRLEPLGQNHFRMLGDLTIKGITKEVPFDLIFGGTTSKDARGLEHAGFTAEATINRRDFGVTGDVFMPGGGSTVADQVKIILDIEFRK